MVSGGREGFAKVAGGEGHLNSKGELMERTVFNVIVEAGLLVIKMCSLWDSGGYAGNTAHVHRTLPLEVQWHE